MRGYGPLLGWPRFGGPNSAEHVRQQPQKVVPANRPLEFEAPGATTNTLIIAIAVMASLYAGREIFVPIALAILLSFVLAPAVRQLQSMRLPRGLAVPIVVLVAFAVIASIGSIVAVQITELAGNLPRYQTTIREKAQAVRGATAGHGAIERAADMLQDLGQELKGKSNSPAGTTANPTLRRKPRPRPPLLLPESHPAAKPAEARADPAYSRRDACA